MNTLSKLLNTNISNPSSVIEQGWSVSVQAVTGCLIKANKVYSISDGVVIGVEQDPNNNEWSVTVEVTSQKWVRYCLLKSCGLKVGQSIKSVDLVGITNSGTVRLEYCTNEKSSFPVRIMGKQLYKHDPTPIIFCSEVK